MSQFHEGIVVSVSGLQLVVYLCAVFVEFDCGPHFLRGRFVEPGAKKNFKRRRRGMRLILCAQACVTCESRCNVVLCLHGRSCVEFLIKSFLDDVKSGFPFISLFSGPCSRLL